MGLFAKSKYAGEKFVIQLMTRYVIIRSSWIYGIGKDFLNEVLEAAADSQVSTMELLNNDRAVPTSAAELARVVKFFIDNDHYGIYHAVCSGGSCTRLEFAKEILRLAGKEDRLTVTVKDGTPDKSYVMDNILLSLTAIEDHSGWRETLASYMKETGGLE